MRLTGNLSDEILPYFSNLPPTLASLGIKNPTISFQLYTSFTSPLLETIGHQLRFLTIEDPFFSSQEEFYDNILEKLPVIHRLSISIELITKAFFQHASNLRFTHPSPIVELEFLTSSPRIGSFVSRINSDMISRAVVDGSLYRLRRLRVHRIIRWGGGSLQEATNVRALSVMLQDRAKQDGDHAAVRCCDAGVWEFGR